MTPSRQSLLRGIGCQVGASLFFALMSCCVYAAHVVAPAASSLHVSMVRATVNLLVLWLPVAFTSGGTRKIFGNRSAALWLRGLFGAGSLMFAFAGTQAIGVAEAGFLTSSSALFVGLLAPKFLGQRNSVWVWGLLLISTFGLYLLMQPRFDDFQLYGRALALLSGFCAAIAYLMVAKVGQQNAAGTIIFYFAFVSTILHLVLLPFVSSPWSSDWRFWLAAMGAGLTATAAQYFMTRAYQLAPAFLAAALGYATPVFSLLFSILLFGRHPDRTALVGSAIVLASGLALPFAVRRSMVARPT